MINGIINVYKEKGFTSFDVVAKLRGIAGQKKIGHTGTLDPDAVGVLPVCFGNATKLCDMLTDKSKEYIADFILGITTDTQDISGKILKTRPVEISEERIREAVLSFSGSYEQIPPMYSALKVNGQRLYDLARQGKEIERKARHVEIPSIEIQSIDMKGSERPAIQMKVSCSKGTYIRTLCYDIGEKLGCGATMTELVRTRVGNFQIENAYRLSEIEALKKADRISEIVLASDAVFAELKAFQITDQAAKYLLNGNKLFANQLVSKEGQCKSAVKNTEQVRVYNEHGVFTAVYEYVEPEKHYKPVKMFFE